uniref:Uncharacterized protein n=1 Tax=Hyaloperonospora arabidopsidis (strain Emoy2) TaxID=559515 RepID=M4BET1_HYAAE
MVKDAVVDGCGEAKIIPLLHKLATRKPPVSRADTWLNASKVRWLEDKRPFAEVFELFDVRHSGVDYFSFHQMLPLQQYNVQFNNQAEADEKVGSCQASSSKSLLTKKANSPRRLRTNSAYLVPSRLQDMCCWILSCVGGRDAT